MFEIYIIHKILHNIYYITKNTFLSIYKKNCQFIKKNLINQIYMYSIKI
jgi:hypothetical protein